MKKYTLAFAALAVFAAAAVPSSAQDRGFEDLDRERKAHPDDANPGESMAEQVDRARRKMAEDVSSAEKAQADEFTKISAETEAQYREFERARARQAAEFRQAVARQWTEYHESTAKEWVDYSGKGDALSRVDFEKGVIRVEVLVPVEEAAPGRKKVAKAGDLDAQETLRLRALAEEKIREQTKKALAQKEEGGPKKEGRAEVLKDQVKTVEGEPVTEKNADSFVKKELAPKMVVDPKPVVAIDGKPRLRVVVEVPLVPDHLRIRAERYKPIVAAYAVKYGLAPELIFAVIQTESDFNPMARSPSGALGLMQLVPRTAANEAYRYLYKEEKMIAPEYLYDPENNIKLGATYLYMLHTRHYGKIKDAENRRTLSIAAYNCGPGNVRATVTSKVDPDTLTNPELVALIRKNAPRETAAYVPRVQERIPLYRGF
jgi:membrane-bound lytic murein transglycosylase C